MKVSAKDLDTGKEQSITITADDRMSDIEIEQAMRDAQQYAGLDTLRKEALEVSSEAQKLINQAQRALKEGKKQIDKPVKKQVKTDINNLSKLLMKLKVDRVTEEELKNIRDAKTDLQNSSACILYLAQ